MAAASAAAAKINFEVFRTAISHCPAISARQTTNTGSGSFFLLSASEGVEAATFFVWPHKPLIVQDNSRWSNSALNSGLGVVPILFYKLQQEHTVNIP